MNFDEDKMYEIEAAANDYLDKWYKLYKNIVDNMIYFRSEIKPFIDTLCKMNKAINEEITRLENRNSDLMDDYDKFKKEINYNNIDIKSLGKTTKDFDNYIYTLNTAVDFCDDIINDK